MTFEEKWNHVARRLFVFFTREGVFNFSLLLLSPLGRVDFASNASKRRERFLFLKRLRAFRLLALQTSIVLTSISFRQATSPRRRTPLSVRLRLPPSPTRRTRPFCRFATFSPFHRGHLPVSSGELVPKVKARNGDLPVLSGEFISNVKASLEK